MGTKCSTFTDSETVLPFSLLVVGKDVSNGRRAIYKIYIQKVGVCNLMKEVGGS